MLKTAKTLSSFRLDPLPDKQEAVLIIWRLAVGGSNERMTYQLLKLNWHQANENTEHNAAWGILQSQF